MCGIAGIIGVSDMPEMLNNMLVNMQHRGPDQSGTYRSNSISALVHLGHRRLSILDTSDAGKQPMQHQQTGVVIVYNGEIYNFRELRKELESLGNTFKTGTDTEVILASYATWGVKALERLRGMFAFAIYDPATREILLARDRLGIKPLYIHQSKSCLIFASELRALLSTGLVDRTIDPQALGAYIWQGFVPGERSLVKDVLMLEPGSYCKVSENGKILTKEKFWSLGDASQSHEQGTTKEERVENAEMCLRESVEQHMVSDVPLGVFLSGGIDSSVVAAMAVEAAGEQVMTFNVRFEENDLDESGYARDVASQLGTEHREIMLTEGDFREGLDDALAALDQPTFDGLNTFFVSRAVRQAGCKVALSGAGGDELFGGYSSFRDIGLIDRLRPITRMLPDSLSLRIFEILSRTEAGHGMPPQTRWGKLLDVLASTDSVSAYQCSYSLFTREFQAQILGGATRGNSWGLYDDLYQQMLCLVDRSSRLQTVALLELSSFIGDRLLKDTDSTSMASSLEVRVPLLDHKFVESVFQMDDSDRFLPLRSKQFLKNIVSTKVRIPERQKAGFELPLAKWTQQSLKPQLDECFYDNDLIQKIGLQPSAIQQLWEAYKHGAKGIYWSRIWALYVLLVWCRDHNMRAS